MDIPDIQSEIDKWLKKNPQVLDYVDWVKYVPQDSPWPERTTHTFRLSTVDLKDEALVAVKVKPLYSAVLTALLKVL